MRSIFKKLSICLTGTAVLMFTAATAWAANVGEIFPVNGIRYSESTIVEGDNTSLTVYKVASKPGAQTGTEAGTGVKGQTLLPGNKFLIDDAVEFKYIKVANLLLTASGEPVNTYTAEYELANTAAAGKLKEYFSSDFQSKERFNAEDLMTELNTALESFEDDKRNEDIETLVNTDGKVLGKVDENGKTSTTTTGIYGASNISQGVYLVVETGAPSNVALRSKPFFVALPMTNIAAVEDTNETYEERTLWQYDVYVYPKNKVVEPGIEKNIVYGDENHDNAITGKNEQDKMTLEKYECANIGDTILYRIDVALPEDVATMSRLEVVDTLGKGLDFQTITQVQIDEKTESYPGEADGSSVQIAVDRNSFKVTPISEDWRTGEKFAIDILGGDNQKWIGNFAGQTLNIYCTAILKENCVVDDGTGKEEVKKGNPNEVKLIYNHNAGIIDEPHKDFGDPDGPKPGEPEDDDETTEDPVRPRVYTFTMNFTKVGSDKEPLKDVEFRLYKPVKDAQGNDTDEKEEVHLSYSKSEDGNDGNIGYYPIVTTGESEPIKTDAEGKVHVYGLEPGIYFLRETKASEGYTLLKEDIKITIEELVTFVDEGIDGEPGTYYEEGTYHKEFNNSVSFSEGRHIGDLVNYGSNKVYTDDTLTTPLEGMKYAKVTINGESSNNGSITIVNNKAIKLPITGGMGIIVFVICGITIFLASAGLVLIRRKRYQA